jgi:hypothetical protein
MSNLVSVRLETVLVSVQDGAWFAPNVEIIWMPLMVLLGHEVQVEACLGLFRDNTNLDAK